MKKKGKKRPSRSIAGPEGKAPKHMLHGAPTEREISERVSLDNKFNGLENKFNQIEQLTRLGEFASGFAHEIRNPVTGISSSAQFLYGKEDIPDKYKEVIEEIMLGSRMLERTVKKYLNMANPSAPRLDMCALNEILLEVCNSLQTKMSSQAIKIEMNLRPGLPEICADAELLCQVFMNIILNSIDAMPAGGKLVVRTFLPEGMEEHEQRVVASISDNGVGINPGDMERVFDPFFTTKKSGTGLGLYTCFIILKRHNANIHFISEAGKGTEAIISFPLPNGG